MGGLKVKGWKKVCHVFNQKKAGAAVLIPYKIDFKAKKLIRNKEVYYTMIKELIHQEDITFLKVYVLNKRASK